jgi:hypothetical protein
VTLATSTIADILGAAAERFLSEAPAPHDTDAYIGLGPYVARLNLVDPELADWVPRHFAHLTVAAGTPNLLVRAKIDPMPLRELEARLLPHVSALPQTSFSMRWQQVRVHLEFDESGLAVLEAIDLSAARAVHIGASLARAREISGIRPLLMLLRWWSEATPHLMLHAAAVGNEQGGVLIGGTPGAGKSSTALACIGDKLQLVGDDMVLIGPDGVAHSLHATLRLRPDMIDRFGPSPWFGNSWSDWRNKPSQIVPDESLQHLTRSTRPKAIVLPRLELGAKAEFSRVSSARAMRVMTPVTVTNHYMDPARQLQKLSNVLQHLPCYEFSIVEDLRVIRESFETFLEDLDRGQ